MDLHEEVGKENEETLANFSPAEEAASKDEVEMFFVALLACLAIYDKHLIDRTRWVCMGES